MAFVERYIRSDAAGGNDGTQEIDAGGGVGPWTLAEGFAHTDGAGVRGNIQNDSDYTIGATTIAQAGTQQAHTVYRGYDTSIGDLEGQGRNKDTTLDTTDFPAITLTGKLTAAAYVDLESLVFAGSITDVLINGGGDNTTITSCSITNSATGSTQIQCAVLAKSAMVANSDIECSGASHGIIVSMSYTASFVGNRVITTDSDPCVSLPRGAVEDNTFIGTTVTGVGVAWINVSEYGGCLTKNNTFYDLGTCVTFPAFAWSATPVLINNHATDSTKWIDNLYSGTALQSVIEINNRLRDITVDPRTTLGDGVLIGEVSTDTGGWATDYENAPTGNLRLIEDAPGAGAGLTAYEDIGAYQREPSAGGRPEIRGSNL